MQKYNSFYQVQRKYILIRIRRESGYKFIRDIQNELMCFEIGAGNYYQFVAARRTWQIVNHKDHPTSEKKISYFRDWIDLHGGHIGQNCSYLPRQRGSTLWRRSKLSGLRQTPFSEEAWCIGKLRESQKMFSYKNGRKSTKCVHNCCYR